MYTPQPVDTAEAVGSAVVAAALDMKDISLVIALTDTGKLARLISKYRPEGNILACSVNQHAVRQMNAFRGVIGFKLATL